MMIIDSIKLMEINKILRSQLQEKLSKKKFCINCHTNFSLNDNDNNICVYHSGQLKYYSCKSCGTDEYYTCCNKCNKCSIGCKKSKHITEY